MVLNLYIYFVFLGLTNRSGIKQQPGFYRTKDVYSRKIFSRAFGLENQFVTHSERLVDANNVCFYPSIITNRWLSVWLENIGNLVT